MKTYICKRHSTDKQDATQQTKIIQDYLNKEGIFPDGVFEESEHGDVDFRKRELGRVIKMCKPGDRIIVSEFSRLNRDISNSMALLDELKRKDITIICANDRSIIGGTGSTRMDKVTTFMKSYAAEEELHNIRNRTKAALSARKELIESNGGFVSKRSGRFVEKLGNTTNLAEAQEKGRIAAAEKRKRDFEGNMEVKKAWGIAVMLRKEGKLNREVSDKMNELGYRTVTGKEYLPQSIPQLINRGNKAWG